MSRPARRARLALAALALVAMLALAACGSDDTSGTDPDSQSPASGSGAQAATVTYLGRVYLVDCTAVAASRLGASLQVAPEQASGQLSAARSVAGVDPSEGFAVRFSNAVCGRGGPEWESAVAAEVARADPARTRSILDLMHSGSGSG